MQSISKFDRLRKKKHLPKKTNQIEGIVLSFFIEASKFMKKTIQNFPNSINVKK